VMDAGAIRLFSGNEIHFHTNYSIREEEFNK
jgi:hypothetical protein